MSEPAALGDPRCVGQRASGGAVCDDGVDVVSARGEFDENVGAGGQSERADSTVLDVRSVLEPRDRRLNVAAPSRAVGIRLALALAPAASVKEQHAVSGAGEHCRTRLAHTRRPGLRPRTRVRQGIQMASTTRAPPAGSRNRPLHSLPESPSARTPASAIIPATMLRIPNMSASPACSPARSRGYPHTAPSATPIGTSQAAR